MRDVLQLAKAVADALKGELHAVHAYDPHPAPRGDSADTGLSPSAEAAGARLDRAVKSLNLSQPDRHLEAGQPSDAVSRVAHNIQADIVVIGEMSRSGIRRALVGNTAEELLDRVPGDLLVVKPRQFTCPVRLESRGTRLVSLLPLG